VTAATRLLEAVRGKGPPRSQAIVLLTDGEDHERRAARGGARGGAARDPIYAVGIGSRSGEPIPELNQDGSVAGYMRSRGAYVTTRLDEKTLRGIADATKGQAILMEPKRFGVDRSSPSWRSSSARRRSRA